MRLRRGWSERCLCPWLLAGLASTQTHGLDHTLRCRHSGIISSRPLPPPTPASVQTENAALHSRTSILEKVLDMRNEQIQVMQESKEVRPSAARRTSHEAPLREHARVCSGRQWSAQGLESTSSRPCHSPMRCPPSHPPVDMQISQHADDPLDAPPLTLTAVTGQTISLTADMLKELTPEQIYKIYQVHRRARSERFLGAVLAGRGKPRRCASQALLRLGTAALGAPSAFWGRLLPIRPFTAQPVFLLTDVH